MAETDLKEVLRAIEELRSAEKAHLDSLERKFEQGLEELKAEQARQAKLLVEGIELRSSLHKAHGLSRQVSDPSKERAVRSPGPSRSGSKTRSAPPEAKSPPAPKKPKVRSHSAQLEALRRDPELEKHCSLQRRIRDPKPDKDPIVRLGHAVPFKVFCSLVVMAGVAIVALESNKTAAYAMGIDLCMNKRGPAPKPVDLTWFTALEYIVVVWMGFELFVNHRTTGAWFSGPDWKWNIFDACVLGSSIVASIAGTIESELRLGRLMKFIRVLRLAKVMKTLRVVRYLHGVRKMILSVLGSLTSLFWALFLMFFFTFLVGVIMLQGVELFYAAKVDELVLSDDLGVCRTGGAGDWDGSQAPSFILPMFSVDPEADHPTEQVVKLYGNVEKTMMTLFGSISGGSEWSVVADPVSRIHPIFTFIWVIFISVMIFGVLNILTGIFCEAAMAAAASDRVAIVNKERDEREEAEAFLRHSFALIDTDNSGILTKEEFFELLSDEEVNALLIHIGIDTSEAGALFALLDEDASGSISFEEFLQGCIHFKGGAQKIDAMHLIIMNRRLMQSMVVTMEMIDEMWTDLEDVRHHDEISRPKAAEPEGEEMSI